MSSSSGKKRNNTVASRYLAAIQCPADEMVVPQHFMERAMSPETFPLKQQQHVENESFGSSKQSSIIQSRSIGNSPSSSRRSRASRTPPRDSVSRGSTGIDVSCNSIPQLKTSGFFPATTSGVVGKHQGEEIDTDGSSLTNSRSSTPPLYDEDDTLAAERMSKKSPGADWKSRMDGTANYYKRRSHKSNSRYHTSPRSSPTESSRIIRQEEAPTEVMMNLSSIQRQQPLRRSPETMTDVTGTSTEIITNRSVDLHRKILRNTDGERDSTDPREMQRPLHQQQGGARNDSQQRQHTSKRQIWPPPKQRPSSSPPPPKPIEIKSLLSDTSITEATEESTGLYPGSMPMGRLGRHVGESKLQENVAVLRQHHRKGSTGSFQDNSLTSSVGVETGVHAVPKSEPALKRVFKQTHPDDGIPVQQRQEKASNIALSRPLSPPPEEEEEQGGGNDGIYRVPRHKEFPPRAPTSSEKQSSSIASNPFMVKYSARGSPVSERRGLAEFGSPKSNASSDGGWTPVPLSSSGMISEDFVLDVEHTPSGKDTQPVTALFSADRIPSTSKSPFDKLYRPSIGNNDEGQSIEDSVGPPNIHRVTAERQPMATHTRAPLDAPGVVASDVNEEQNDVIPGLTPDIQVNSPLVASAPAAFEIGRNDASGGNNARKQSTRSSPMNRARRRALLNRRRRWPPENNDEVHRDDDERHGEDGEPDSDGKPQHPVQSLTASLQATQENVSLSRNLFPAQEQRYSDMEGSPSNGDFFGREPAIDRDTRDESRVNVDDYPGVKIHKEKSSLHESSGEDRANSFISPRPTSNEFVPPWKAKSKEQASAKKARADATAPGGDEKEPKPQYIPPWKRKLLEASNKARSPDADNVAKEGETREKAVVEYVPQWKRKVTDQGSVMNDKRIDSKGTEAPADDVTISNDAISPWKLKATAAKKGTGANSMQATSGMTPPLNIPKWKLELMKKKGLVKDEVSQTVVAPLGNNDERQVPFDDVAAEADDRARPSPPKALFSVQERINALTSSTRESQQYVPPWVAKARTPTGTGASSTHIVKSAPPRLSGRDRAVAMSGDTNELSYVSGSSSRSKRSFNEAIADDSPSADCGIEADDSPQKHRKRSRTGSQLLGAVQVDPSIASGPSVEDSKNSEDKSPQKSLLLAAHLAATADDVSPQDRYRRRLKRCDETTGTGGTREGSDVQSLKSFFEASVATGPSDEDDSDDRTVESLRSKFEPIPENEERPNDVSRMRAMFESRNASGTSKKGFGGNNAVNDAYSRFKPATPRWTPSGRAKPSPQDEQNAERSSPGKQVRVSSAPSKLQSNSSRRLARSPPPKPEDMVRVPTGKVMSVAERIQALKLKESPQSTSNLISAEPTEAADRNVRKGPAKATANSSSAATPRSWKKTDEFRTKSRDPPAQGEPLQVHQSTVDVELKEPPKRKSPQGASFPSVKDRVNAFSGRGRQASPNTGGSFPSKPAPPARKSFPDESGIRSYSNRHLVSRAADDQVQQALSIPSDEKTGSDTRRSTLRRNASHASSDATSDDSDYDDGVTLDLSIAEISQLTNPTCIQSKEGGADSSSEASSEHTSDVNRGSNVGSNVEGKHPSEASSSQASEAAAPLIARMKFSDDASLSSDKGAFPGRSRTKVPSRWEPLTPVVDEAVETALTPIVDEATEPARLSPDGTHESAWSPDEIATSFPVDRRTNNNSSSVAVTRNKDWQPFKVENWDLSTSFNSNWTPPSNADGFSDGTSFGRQNTPVRRNTSASRRASPPFNSQASPITSGRRSPISSGGRRSPVSSGGRRSPPSGGRSSPSSTSPAERSLFSRTHPSRPPSTSPVAAAPPRPSSAVVPATPRSSPVKASTTTTSPRESAPKTATTGGATSRFMSNSIHGISKHALLMSKLRSLKEARMRRNAAVASNNFQQRTTPSPTQHRPPIPSTNSGGSSASKSRTSPPTTSALAPFLRPGFESTVTTTVATKRYPDRVPRTSPIMFDNDEQSLSTKSSTQFGGNKFLESLELD